MEHTQRPRVKVCCISSIEEAQTAIRAGAAAIGLVSMMPSGPGIISEELIAAITQATPRSIDTFLLTCKQSVQEIVQQQRRCGTNTIQICDRLTSGTHSELREALPGVALAQVIHIAGEKSVEEALSIAPAVDALLLDSGNPALARKELGGTGRLHDWTLSRTIRERSSKPVFLAGGLRAENVRQAIEQVGAFALDVCTGVRTDGRLDEGKLKHFFAAVNQAG